MSNNLTDKQCQIILQNRFKTQAIKYLSSELKPISENAEGFMGEHYKFTLRYELNGKTSKEDLFLKRKPSNKLHSDATDEMHVYEKEIFFYNILQKEFEKKGYDTSFAAKSFYCVPNEAIIMENLIAKGYTLLERTTVFNLNKMKCVLKALALYHGAGFAYEKSKSKELGKLYKFTDDYGVIIKETFYCQYLETNSLAKQLWDGTYKTLLCLIDILPKDKKYREEFKTLLNNYKMANIFADKTNLPKTCCHGDLWSNNMMFKLVGNDATECCLLDFQLVRYFYPAFDIILAIYCNTDLKFREKHLEELFTYYYNTLREILNNYGYSIEETMTLEEYYLTLHLVKVDSLTQVAFAKTIICIPKEILTESMKNDDKAFENTIMNNSEQASTAFQLDESYRNTVSEILYELRDALISRKDDENWDQ